MVGGGWSSGSVVAASVSQTAESSPPTRLSKRSLQIGSFLLVDDAVLKVGGQPVVNGANCPVVECILVSRDPLMQQSRFVRSDHAVCQ